MPPNYHISSETRLLAFTVLAALAGEGCASPEDVLLPSSSETVGDVRTQDASSASTPEQDGRPDMEEDTDSDGLPDGSGTEPQDLDGQSEEPGPEVTMGEPEPEHCIASEGAIAEAGVVERRTRYASAQVPFGETCESEEQTRRCDAGTWSQWSGSFAAAECQVSEPANCDGAAHSTIQQRERFASEVVPFGQLCEAETQERTCLDGTWTEWTGNHTTEQCEVALPAGCEGGVGHSEAEQRTRYHAPVSTTGPCEPEIQERFCTDGSFGQWSGSATEASCLEVRPALEMISFGSELPPAQECSDQTSGTVAFTTAPDFLEAEPIAGKAQVCRPVTLFGETYPEWTRSFDQQFENFGREVVDTWVAFVSFFEEGKYIETLEVSVLEEADAYRRWSCVWDGSQLSASLRERKDQPDPMPVEVCTNDLQWGDYGSLSVRFETDGPVGLFEIPGADKSVEVPFYSLSTE